MEVTFPTGAGVRWGCLVKIYLFICFKKFIKKAEGLRIDVLELWCWRRLLKAHWTTRRSNHSTLKEMNPEYSLEGTDAKPEIPLLWPPDAKG